MENDKKIKEDILEIVWAGNDILRGIIDPDKIKDYILKFFFWKYLSDSFISSYKEIDLNISDKSLYDYVYKRREQSNISEIIDKALKNIEADNKDKLEGVFSDVDFNAAKIFDRDKQKNNLFKLLLKKFNELDLTPKEIKTDLVGEVYRELINLYAKNEGKTGEYITPFEISDLLARLVEPKKGDKIHDPASGSATLIIKTAQRSSNCSIYGQEINSSNYALAKINLFISNLEGDIKWGDSLKNPRLIKDSDLINFDIVVSNPPFSLSNWWDKEIDEDKYDRFQFGMPPKRRGDFAFISHIIKTMKDEVGRAGVIVPLGVLFRGRRDKKIRQNIIKANLLDAVIRLPSNLFHNTSIPAAILIFKKQRKREDIIFIDASEEYINAKFKNKLNEKHIDKIYQAYNGYKTVDRFSYVASQQEIADNNYNLNIARYVDNFEQEEDIDIDQLEGELKTTKKEIEDIEEKIDNNLSALKEYN